ncbi:MAG: hypothetical protein JWP91_4063 [Fibrobacteres bacterium]|nr:hypothetical protein [Fibrobacterota bacterium]
MIKSIKTGLVMVATLCIAPSRAAWTDPPLVNTIQSATANLGLNFGSPGIRQQIALFVVNSNDSTGFHVTFTFTNKGFFKVGARQFAMSNIVLSSVSGTLGAGLAAPADMALSVNPGTGVATWNPTSVPPTSATDNYLIAIYADWADQSARLAGFYQETITATIVSGP